MALPVYVYSAPPSEDFIRHNSIEITGANLDSRILTTLEKYRVIAIGEHHGNDKTPLLAGQIAEALTQTSDVVLGLEIQKANQFGLDEYGRTGDKYLLRLLAHFAREYQDGRSSVAMVQLLDMVRKNRKIQIFAFDPDFDSGGQDRDTKMAENILKVVKANPNKRFVLLAGNVHSSIKIGNFFDPNYLPMGYQLSALPNSPLKPANVFSVMTRYEHAKIWACINNNVEDCGPMKLKEDTSSYSIAVPFGSYFLVEPSLSDEVI